MAMDDSNFDSCSPIAPCSEEIDFILNIKSPILKLAEAQKRKLLNDVDFCVPECTGWSYYKQVVRQYFHIFMMSMMGFITMATLCLQVSNMACNPDANHMQSVPRIINMIDRLMPHSEKSDNYHGVY